MASKGKTYEEFQKDLDEILAKIQSEDEKGNLTELMKLYEQGESIVESMQHQLEQAKNTVKKLP